METHSVGSIIPVGGSSLEGNHFPHLWKGEHFTNIIYLALLWRKNDHSEQNTNLKGGQVTSGSKIFSFSSYEGRHKAQIIIA